jgi:tetratricopeptide (TPR) repeat protein
VDARLARAALHAALHQAEAAAQDLEVADRAAAKESDAQLAIAAVYEAIDQPAAAIVHYSRWIDLHARENSRMPAALNGRCFARALVGTGLTQALVDCNAAMKMRPNTAAFLGSRGLVYLRQDELGKAIADYDAALRLRPHAAWSLYGRGLAKLRQDQSVEGQADLAAAIALEPLIAERAGKFGLHP